MSGQLPGDQTPSDHTGGASNSLAVVGFTLSLCVVVFFWIPYLMPSCGCWVWCCRG